MADEYQKELFEEFGKEKGKLKRMTEKIVRRQNRLYLRISPENAVFAAIIIIMCIIVSFALGVERGKSLAPSVIIAPEKKIEPKREPEIKPPSIEVPEGIYTIQLISYKKKAPAEKEKRKLTKKGIEAFIIASGEWFQVCAGSYTDTKKAGKALDEFSKKYKGCFIRKKGKGVKYGTASKSTFKGKGKTASLGS